MGNTILIIGNGFDLYHKLPTRYTDFLAFAEGWDYFKKIYDSYIGPDGKVIQSDINPDEQFKVRLSEGGKLTNETIEDYANHAVCFDINHLHYLNDNIQNNTWIEYFKTIDYKKDGWIDFEREMEKVLQCIEEYYSYEIRNHVGRIPNIHISKRMSSIILEFGKKASEPFRNMNSSTIHSDDIEQVGLETQKLALLDAMKYEMDVLNQCLYYYLADFVSSIKCNLYSEQVKDLVDVHLLNFNYTYTYHSVYGKYKLTQHHPIHGELKSNDLVLGVSDDSFTNLDYLYFQKYFQRIQKKTGAYYKKWIPDSIKTLDDSPATVHIIGHSLDKTDKGVLKDIFSARSIEKIYIYYHNQIAYEGQVINLIGMFGKDFVINQTAEGRIEFEKFEKAIEGSTR